jgi:hypothetical protein
MPPCVIYILPFVSLGEELGLFRTIAPTSGGASGPGGQRPFRPVRGKLGLFRTLGRTGPRRTAGGSPERKLASFGALDRSATPETPRTTGPEPNWLCFAPLVRARFRA